MSTRMVVVKYVFCIGRAVFIKNDIISNYRLNIQLIALCHVIFMQLYTSLYTSKSTHIRKTLGSSANNEEYFRTISYNSILYFLWIVV